LLAERSIPKAAFNDFALLHQLGDTRLEVNSDSVLVTRRKDGSLVVATWNLFLPGKLAPQKLSRSISRASEAPTPLVSLSWTKNTVRRSRLGQDGHPAFPTWRKLKRSEKPPRFPLRSRKPLRTTR